MGRNKIKSYSFFNAKGAILIISLWTLCLLSTLVIYVSYGVRQKVTLASRIEGRNRLRLIAEAGIKSAIMQLKKEEPKAYDALNDTWSENIEVFKDKDTGSGKVDVCYTTIDEETGLKKTHYGLIDEERKININKVDMKILKRLFRIVLNFDEREAEELAASIVDWRDSDSKLSIPLGSAEDSYYRDLRYAYEAKDADFEVLDEILLVKGMTEEVYGKIKDYITIYSTGNVNINTASRPVLLALGLSDEIVSEILPFRAGEDKIPGTADDRVFNAPSDIAPRLSQFYNLSEADIAQITKVSEQFLSSASNNFMARSVASLNDKNVFETICVIGRNGKVLYWQEL
jgi:general secretion pathway protein K